MFTFGRIEGGHNSNVIPERVELRGTCEHSIEVFVKIAIATIRRLAASVADGTRTSIHVEFGVEARSVVNDKSLIDLIESVTTAALGAEAVEPILQPSMGSEDFSFYGDEVASGHVSLGVRVRSDRRPRFALANV